MGKSEELALFLGMLSGDGCLSIAHNGEGYRDYPIDFCNTDKEKVLLFHKLFYNLFGVQGKIYSQIRQGRKRLWTFRKFSVEIAKKIKELGFPEGVKRDVLRVLPIIKNGTKAEKLAFINGVIITDGSIKKNGILFHSGSKLFLEDLSLLISGLTGTVKPVREFIQREIYRSYQLYLNKPERDLILSSPDATMVLGRS